MDLPSAPSPPTPAVPAARPYEAFYGLREHPFGPSTDPRFYFPSAEHERAADAIVAAVHARQAATLLTGEPAVGKTTLCRAVVRRLDRRTVSSLVLEPVASADDLLKQMLVDFGVVAR
ncbi:MAG TPA: AAA family ATPase, partial [Vicinamibacterales bacterium]|nr:AAA family ATPase [Vicinamibacterales bacterium]